jgi:hypothetical protein
MSKIFADAIVASPERVDWIVHTSLVNSVE